MELFGILFKEILYRPLYNLLVFFYNVLPGHDFGVAIIVLTLAVKALLYFPSQSAIRTQKIFNELQPKIKEIQEKFKTDKTQQGVALMEMYKANKVNPLSSLLPLFIQVPLLIALFKVLWSGLDANQLNGLYSFVQNPGLINPMFLGLLNLSQAVPFLAVLAGLSQFVQSKMMMPKIKKAPAKDDFAGLMNQQMLYMMPFLTVVISWKLPAGLTLYWTVMTIFSIIQQYFVLKKSK